VKTTFIDTRLVKYALLFSSITLMVIYGSLSSVYAISLTDYTFPESSSQQGHVKSDFSLSNELDPNKPKQSGYHLGGIVSYDRFYTSLPFEYTVKFAGTFDFDKGTDKGADSDQDYDMDLKTDLKKYISDESSVFGLGAVDLEYRKQPSADEADDVYAVVRVGAGYGRRVDATVLKQAMRINEDLKKYNVIKQDIPDNAMLELARIIARENEYQSKYSDEEYKKYWYEDMEKIIRESGTLSHETLGAMGIIRIQEILDEHHTGLRLYGWQASAAVGLVISDFEGEKGDPDLLLKFEWARPLTLQLQLNNTTFAKTVFADDQTYTLNEAFEVYYELSDKIDWNNTFTINYDILTAKDKYNTLTLKFASTYYFYLANQLTLEPNFTYSYVDDGVDDTTWNWKFSGSVDYRFL